ncbi:GL14383 [Drosophila persimilis]|uniref:GL14383 n=1 Tax=Drosophila persimilis TaxID=7234 RepID=B4GTM6_DROPE|nr:GL14383 [Drosophila persimilis]
MAHEENDPPNDFVRKLASESDIDVLIDCDANAHQTQWGSSDTNSQKRERGEPLGHWLQNQSETNGSRDSQAQMGHKHLHGWFEAGTDGRVAGGIYSEQLNIRHSFRLPDQCSVFQAEVTAIREALNCLQTATAADCPKSFLEMAQKLAISLIWVPGHRDIEGNCIADELPRYSTTTPNLRDKDDIFMRMALCSQTC